jgi:hypothetical protein
VSTLSNGVHSLNDDFVTGYSVIDSVWNRDNAARRSPRRLTTQIQAAVSAS